MPRLVWIQLILALLPINLAYMRHSPKLLKTEEKHTLSKTAFDDPVPIESNILLDTEYERELQKRKQSLRIFVLPERSLRNMFEAPQKLTTKISNTLNYPKNTQKSEANKESLLKKLLDHYPKDKGSLYVQNLSQLSKHKTEYPNNKQNNLNWLSDAKQLESISKDYKKYSELPDITFHIIMPDTWNKFQPSVSSKLDAPKPYGKKEIKKQPNSEAERNSFLETLLDHYPKKQGSIHLQNLGPVAKLIKEDRNLQKSSSKAKETGTISKDNNYSMLPQITQNIWSKLQSRVLSKLHGDPYGTRVKNIERCGRTRRGEKNQDNKICYTYPNYVSYGYYPYYYYYPTYYYPYYYWGRR